jgi:hypothetical protein
LKEPVWDPICPLSKLNRVCGQAKTALGEILNAVLVQRTNGSDHNKLDPE